MDENRLAIFRFSIKIFFYFKFHINENEFVVPCSKLWSYKIKTSIMFFKESTSFKIITIPNIQWHFSLK